MKGNIYNSTEDIPFGTGVCNQEVCSSLDYRHQPNPRRACMDTGQWHQEMALVNPMEELVCPSSATTTTTTTTRPQVVERRARPQREQALNCPRCNSTNTKFCYYNNYSLTQPRYFCKTCRRYWTEGGSLRNVPVGGGSRKNKRSSSSSSASATTASTTTTTTITQNPKFHGGQDLNLTFAHHSLPEFGDFPNMESSSSCTTTAANSNSIATRNCSNLSTTAAMELLRTGISGVPFMQVPVPNTRAAYPPGFGLQDFRHPTFNFPLEGIGGAVGGGGGGYGGLQGVQEGAGRLLFPFEDLKVSPTIAEFEQNRGQGGDPPGFWNGMIGGGGNW